MKLVIEREGGFTIVDDADAITEIDVRNDAVVLTIEVGGDKWVATLPVKGHAEACRVSAAIAVKCGVLVEPLAKGPEVVTEAVMFDGSEVIEAPRNPNWSGRKASEWVPGEPPKDGEVYQVEHTDPRRMGSRTCARWVNRHWFRCDGGVLGEITAWFRVTCEPEPVMPKPASEWVDGEPPRDGRWYVVNYGLECNRIVRWILAGWLDASGHVWGGSGPSAHLPTPIPNR